MIVIVIRTKRDQRSCLPCRCVMALFKCAALYDFPSCSSDSSPRSGSLEQVAKRALVDICREEWVKEKFLRDPEKLMDARTREIQRLLFRYYKSITSPNTRLFACGLGSCTLQTRPIPREHQKTAWEEHETSDTPRLIRLRRTHTRDSTATFPLL